MPNPGKQDSAPTEREAIDALVAHMPSLSAREIQASLEQLRAGTRQAYHVFDIPKGNGRSRTIHAPNDNLKYTQAELADEFTRSHISPHAHAFHKGRSAPRGLRQMANAFAKMHGNATMPGSRLAVDIEDFFPSIPEGQVREQLLDFNMRILHFMRRGPRYSPMMVEAIANLQTELCTADGRLNQGPPSSAPISNMVAKRFDYPIAHKTPNDHVLGRFADDYEFWALGQIGEHVLRNTTSILGANGYRLSDHKTEQSDNLHNGMEVWGLQVVKPNPNTPEGVRFRIPHEDQKQMKVAIDAVLDTPTDQFSTETNAFYTDSRITQCLGYFGRVYDVSKYGRDIPKDSHYMLPHSFAKRWTAFCKKFRGVMVSTAPSSYTQFETTITTDWQSVPVQTSGDMERRVRHLCEIGADEHGDEAKFRRAVIGNGGHDAFRHSLDVRKASLAAEFGASVDGPKNPSGQLLTDYLASQWRLLAQAQWDDDADGVGTSREAALNMLAVAELKIDGDMEFPDGENVPRSLLPVSLVKPWGELRGNMGAYMRHHGWLDNPVNWEQVTEEAVGDRKEFPVAYPKSRTFLRFGQRRQQRLWSRRWRRDEEKRAQSRLKARTSGSSVCAASSRTTTTSC